MIFALLVRFEREFDEKKRKIGRAGEKRERWKKNKYRINIWLTVPYYDLTNSIERMPSLTRPINEINRQSIKNYINRQSSIDSSYQTPIEYTYIFNEYIYSSSRPTPSTSWNLNDTVAIKYSFHKILIDRSKIKTNDLIVSSTRVISMIPSFESIFVDRNVHDDKTDQNSLSSSRRYFESQRREKTVQTCANKIVSRVIYPSKRVVSREAAPIHRSPVHRAMTRSTPPFPPPPPLSPPESMLHEFTADSETTRSLSRNAALQPIFVELPRFVNDKGSNRERYFPSRDQSLYGLLRTGKRFLSRQTSPISDSTRANGTRERELDIGDFVYIYIYCLIWTEGIVRSSTMKI